MQSNNSDIIIIGAGLTGLTLAHYLRQRHLVVHIVEGRDRIGGRIFTHHTEGMAPIELGATWLGTQHSHLMKLLQELGIEIFKQELGDVAIYEPISTSPPQLVRLPPNDEPSFRVKGGTDRLIHGLANYLDEQTIYLSQIVKSIHIENNMALVRTDKSEFSAPIVVSTLPPYLFVNSIEVKPDLPSELLSIANQTHTWMGESIKIGLTYAHPFWKAVGSSGTIFSNVGPIPEMYDHSDFEESHVALMGFLNGAYFSIGKKERQAIILQQLEKYYGPQVHDYLDYSEFIWRNDGLTFREHMTHVFPHQNNGHHVYQKACFDGRLYIAGTETSAQYPGYMEGAVRSAQNIYLRLFE
jgi:monoamine oxidase